MRFMKLIDERIHTLSNVEIIRAIRKGLLYMMPLVLTGSFVVMILNLPVPAFQELMDKAFTARWREIALAMHNGTFQIMSITAVTTISYSLAMEKQAVKSGNINALSVVLTALASYIAFMWDGTNIIKDSALNSTGLLGAIIVAALSSYIFLFLCRFKRKSLHMHAFDSDTVLLYALGVAVPSLLTIFIFGMLRVAVDTSGLNESFAAIYDGAARIFTGNKERFSTAIVFTLITHVMWFFGLHGTNILDGVAHDLFVTASEANILLFESGFAPTNILTKEFFDNFVYMGGCGCTLGLTIALLVAGKRGNVNRVAKYSIFPAVFNINEILVYGLPVIFNPYYLIPFLLTPCLLSVSTYAAMALGFVPYTVVRTGWTTPILLSGYVSTGGSFSGVILQIVNLALSVLIYFPFIRMYQKSRANDRQNIFDALSGEIMQPDRNPVINRPDEIGVLARALAMEIEDGLKGSSNAMHMEYQPKVNINGEVVGSEALLRWIHPVFGYISPAVTLGIAEEAGFEDILGRWTLERSFTDMKNWLDKGYTGLTLSVNVTPAQLHNDSGLVDYIEDLVEKTGVIPEFIELELTENAAVDRSESTRRKLEQLKNMGISISIDDFGMGNSSILYLRDLYANVVKIDMSLVHRITGDKHSQEIVSSIVRLCDQLDVGVVAEGVESKEQAEKLEELGCHVFQGFLFSRALKQEAYLEYIDKFGRATH